MRTISFCSPCRPARARGVQPRRRPAQDRVVGEAMPDCRCRRSAEFVSRSGSPDASQLVFQSPAAADHRCGLLSGAFTAALEPGERHEGIPAGPMALYAEQESHPDVGAHQPVRPVAPGSKLIGAFPSADSAFAARARRPAIPATRWCRSAARRGSHTPSGFRPSLPADRQRDRFRRFSPECVPRRRHQLGRSPAPSRGRPPAIEQSPRQSRRGAAAPS